MDPNPRHDRHVLVTGATRGLGPATALAFAELGDRVTLTGRGARTLDTLDTLVTRAAGPRPRVTGVVLDVDSDVSVRCAAGRVLNVSSTMGSLSDQEDPASPYYDALVPAYRASKAALNSLTIGLARKLEGTSVIALAVCPGFMQTELTPANAEQAPLRAEESAAFLVQAADADRASGSFVDRDGVVAW